MSEFNNRPAHWVELDADDQGARLCSLAEYHNWIGDQWRCGEVTNEDYADTCYMLGNIEGRLLHNHVTMDDVELMDLWFEEMHPAELRPCPCITIQIPLYNVDPETDERIPMTLEEAQEVYDQLRDSYDDFGGWSIDNFELEVDGYRV